MNFINEAFSAGVVAAAVVGQYVSAVRRAQQVVSRRIAQIRDLSAAKSLRNRVMAARLTGA